MYTVLLFDLDGTLIDSAADIAASVNHVRAEYSLPALPLPAVEAAIGEGLAVLLERTVPGAPPAAARDEYWRHHAEHCLDHTVLYPGVREGLARLAARAQLGVVTNKPQAFSERILTGLDVLRHFRVLVGGDTPAGRKPEPGPLLAALHVLGEAPWNACMVGDSAGDVRAARAALTGAAFVSWGYRTLAELADAAPDHVLHGFAEVETLLAHDGTRRVTVYDRLGAETFWRIARAFYRRVDEDPRIRAMFPRSLTGPIERQATFLIQFFGGPSDYGKARGHPRLRMRHAPFAIGRAARDAWFENMCAALEEVGVEQPMRGVMLRYFAHTATFLQNA
jgi:2-phosphoglycolate phosphatase